MGTQSLERATVFEGCQVGIESTPGTAVSANKRLLCTSIENLRPEIPSQNFRTYGSKASTSVVRGKGHGVAGVTAAMNPWDMAYLLATGLCSPTITTPGGATNTRNHAFKMRNFHPDTIDTLTIDKGSFAGGERATYGVLNGFSLNVAINEAIAQLTGSMITRTPTIENVWPTGHEVYSLVKDGTVSGGTFTLTPNGGSATGNINWDDTAAEIQAILEANAAVGVGDVACFGGPLPSTTVYIVVTGNDFGTNPTDWTIDDTNITGGGDMILTKVQDGATITDLDNAPLSSAEFDIYVSETYAGLPAVWTTGNDADSLLRCSSANVTLPERWIPNKVLRTDHSSFTSLVENNVEGASVQISHMANAQGRAFMSHFVAGTRLFFRIVGTGAEIEANFPCGVMITGAFEVSNYEHADNGGVYDANITGTLVYDSDLGGFLDVQLRNDLTSL